MAAAATGASPWSGSSGSLDAARRMSIQAADIWTETDREMAETVREARLGAQVAIETAEMLARDTERMAAIKQTEHSLEEQIEAAASLIKQAFRKACCDKFFVIILATGFALLTAVIVLFVQDSVAKGAASASTAGSASGPVSPVVPRPVPVTTGAVI
jgi:hypothetical protein